MRDAGVQTKSLPVSASFAQPCFASSGFQDLGVFPAGAASSVAKVVSGMRLMKWALGRDSDNRQGPLALCAPKENNLV